MGDGAGRCAGSGGWLGGLAGGGWVTEFGISLVVVASDPHWCSARRLSRGIGKHWVTRADDDWPAAGLQAVPRIADKAASGFVNAAALSPVVDFDQLWTKTKIALIAMGASVVAWAVYRSRPRNSAMHQFDVSSLAAGDVVLSTRPFAFTLGALKSLGIRAVTWSDWSHAAIVSTSGHLVEAVGNGVLRLSIAGVLIEGDQNVEVLRLKPQYGGSSAADAAAAFAEAQVSHKYASLQALMHSVLAIRCIASGPKEHEHFCSHLVAQSYESVGVPIHPLRCSERITPAHLKNSDAFSQITDEVLMKASAAMTALPLPVFGDRLPDVPQEELLEREVVELAMAAVQDYEISPRPTTLAAFAEAIASGFRETPEAARAFDAALLSKLESAKWREVHDRIVDDASLSDLCNEIQKEVNEGVLDAHMSRAMLMLFRQQEHSKTKANEQRRSNYEHCMRLYSKMSLQSFKYLADDFLNMWNGGEAVLSELRATIALLDRKQNV